MLWYSPLLTLVAIGFSLLPIFVSVVFGSKAEKAEKAVSDRKEHYTGMLKDTLTGFAVIKSSKAEKNIARMHDAQNESVADASKKRTGIGVLNTCEEEKVWGIGVDADQAAVLGLNYVLSSALKDAGAGAVDIAKAVMNELLENAKFENCLTNEGYTRAMGMKP